MSIKRAQKFIWATNIARVHVHRTRDNWSAATTTSTIKTHEYLVNKCDSQRTRNYTKEFQLFLLSLCLCLCVCSMCVAACNGHTTNGPMLSKANSMDLLLNNMSQLFRLRRAHEKSEMFGARNGESRRMIGDDDHDGMNTKISPKLNLCPIRTPKRSTSI